MVDIVGHTTAGGWEDSTTIAVPTGVQEGDLLRVWISANDTPQIEVPDGWDLEVSDVGEGLGGNTAVYSFIRTATSSDENSPTYTWNWPGGEHWRFAVMVALSGAAGVRDYVLSADPNTSSLDSAELDAQTGDLLLVCGYNRHDTEKTWSPSGLTEIANLDRGVVAAYEVPDEGPVQVYTLTAGQSGTMAVLTVLIEPVPVDEDPVLWTNSFNGAHGTAITVANSSDHGDALASVAPPAFYQRQALYRGAGAAYVGSTRTRGNIAVPLGVGQNEPYALRFYFNLITNASLVVGNNPDSPSGTFVCQFFGNTGDSPASMILSTIANDHIMSFRNTWTRLEYVRGGEGGSGIVRMWWSDPADDAPGSHDLEITGPGVGPAMEVLYFRGTDPGQTDPETGPIQYGIYLDEIAVAPGSTEFIGPVPDPVVEPTWQNSLDGTPGTNITVANSSEHGGSLGYVGNQVQYSDDWYVDHVGGGQASARVRTGFELPEPGSNTWTLRWYQYVESELNVGGTRSLLHTAANSFLYVLNQDYSDFLHEVVGRTVRCEIMCRSGALTARLWWTNPDSWENPDLTVSGSGSSFPSNGYINFNGFNTDGYAYVDELAMSDEAGIIGPVAYNRADASVRFTATARGVVGGAANAVYYLDVGTQAQGYRSDEGAAVESVNFEAEASGEGFIPTVAAAQVEYTGEASGGPLYTGNGSYDLDIDVETSATKATSGDALEGEVVYNGQAQGRARTHLPDVPLVGMQYRLIAYDPNGQRRGQLPWPLSFQLGVPLNDIPSLALEYLKDAPGASLLGDLCEVAVEFAQADSPTFIEPPGCRFLNLRHQENHADRTGVVRYTMPSYAWMLRKVRNLNTNALNEEGQREFSQATPGRIIHTFLTEAQSRNNVPGLVWDFTSTHDSAGQPWASAYNISFDAGQDLWSILEALATQHALDWRVHRRTLQMYNPDTAMNRDRSEQAVLRLHRDVTEAPNDRSGEELASRIFVQGDNAHVQITHNNPVMAPWGAWEDYISQSGVSDTGTLTALARWRLDATRGLRTQMTRGIVFNTTRHLPFFAYQVGDYISAPGWFSQMDPLRVRQITITSTDPHSLEGNLVLNDRFIERDLRNDRKINALTGGAPPGGGGGGGRPPGEDTRTPRAPQNLLLQSDAYINEYGEPRALITADWNEVTHATNNTEMDIRRYEIWFRRAAFGSIFQFQTEVDHPQTTAFMSWFEPGEVYEFRVRAFGRNDRPGLWSETVAVMAERDTDPPEEPSEPDVSSRLGVLRVAWNGLDFHGMAMAPDFDHLQVWMGESTSGEFEHVDTLYRAGVSVIPNQPYGEERFFFFVALDRAGNESEPSAIASGVTERLVPIDVTPGSIGYELLEEGAVRDEILADDAVMNRHIAAGQITGEKIRAYSLTADRIAVGSSRNLLVDPKLLNADLNELRNELSTGQWEFEEHSSGNAAAITTGEDNSPGTYEFRFIQSLDVDSLSDRRAGYSVSAEMGRVIYRSMVDVELGGQGTVLIHVQARYINRDDVLSGVVTAVSQQSFTESVQGHELVSGAGATIPDGAIAVVLCVVVSLSSAPTGTTVRIRNPFSAMSDGQVLIENGAVSANKIAANAVTADKIQAGAIRAQHIQADAIDADKIAARAITAKHTIIGASIQTTAQAQRGVEMTSTGVVAYDNIGQETFRIVASTGSVNMIGRLRTGRVGQNHVDISDSANYLNQPGLRLYSGAGGALDSSLFIADRQGTGGWEAYTVALTGAETTRNSTGRTDLAIRPRGGGGASLRYQWSNWGIIGIDFSDYQMHIYGRNSTGQHSNAYMVWGRTPTLRNSGSEFSGTAYQVMNYGAAPPVSSRLVQVSGHANHEFAKVASTVSEQMPTHVRLSGSRYNGGSFRLQYFAMWVQASVAS